MKNKNKKLLLSFGLALSSVCAEENIRDFDQINHRSENYGDFIQLVLSDEVNDSLSNQPVITYENNDEINNNAQDFFLYHMEVITQEPRVGQLLDMFELSSAQVVHNYMQNHGFYNRYDVMATLIRDCFSALEENGDFDHEEDVASQIDDRNIETWIAADTDDPEPALTPRPLFELREALAGFVSKLINLANQTHSRS